MPPEIVVRLKIWPRALPLQLADGIPRLNNEAQNVPSGPSLPGLQLPDVPSRMK